MARHISTTASRSSAAWGLIGGACGFVVGAGIGAGVIIAGAGIFWLFVFGDNPWPGLAEDGLVAVALVVLVVATFLGARAGIARASARRTRGPGAADERGP